MNVKKAIKRIAALAAGTTMVTATIMGAMAYDLSDYPTPFVEDGVFQGKLVVGQSAQVSDVIGAIDIAASLQAASKSGVSVDGSETVSVEGGVQIKGSSDDFNFGDTLAIDGGEYDSDDFETLLADGIVEDDDGTEYDYEQTITLGDAELMYDQDDDYGDDPVFYLDIGDTSTPEIVYRVEMKDQLNVTELVDSETIEIFGTQFTFDPGHTTGDDLTLYGSDTTVVVTQEEPITVEVDGEEYTIEILGGNSDDSTAIIRVTGDGTETKTLEAGDSRDMAGLDIFIDDVFVSNIGDDTISVSVFVGSNKIVIPAAGISAVADSYTEIEINDDDETDIWAWVDGTGLDAVDNIYFKIDPTDFMDENIDDEWNWLPMGEEFTDPLFGFSLAFEGMTPSIEGRNMVEFSRASDTYSLAFENNDGDEYDFEVYQSDGTNLTLGDDLVLNASSVNDGKIFILEQTETKEGDSTTYIFEVRDVDDSTGDEKITLKDLGSGSTTDYDDGDEIEDTGVYIEVDNTDTFSLYSDAGLTTSTESEYRVVTKGGLIVTLDTAITSDDDAEIVIYEDSEDEDNTNATNLAFNIIPDADDDIVFSGTAAWGAGGAVSADTDGDVSYGISDYGTWFEQEEDNNGDYLRVYYSETETDFDVFLNGPDAVVIKTGVADSTAYTVNNFVVGQIAVYDNEAAGMVGDTPLIVVGGPCVNTVAMNLMGNPEVCWEGFTEGKAKIVLFEDQNALMVAGYSGEDTTGAAQVLAEEAYGADELSGSEVEVITTDLSMLEVNVVE